jgi:hypothetical protein
MQDKANRKMAKEGGMIYYHIKSVPYIGGNWLPILEKVLIILFGILVFILGTFTIWMGGIL